MGDLWLRNKGTFGIRDPSPCWKNCSVISQGVENLLAATREVINHIKQHPRLFVFLFSLWFRLNNGSIDNKQ